MPTSNNSSEASQRSAKPRSRRRRPRPSEDTILAAAEAVFGARGFGPPSLRDLIAAAGCSTTAFYARFSDKEAVLFALVGRMLDDLAEAAAAALPTATSLEHGFALGVDVLLSVVVRRRALVGVALTAGADVPTVKALLGASYAGLAALLTAELSRARVSNAPSLSWALVGAVDMQLRRWAVFGALEDADLVEALRAVSGAMVPSPAAENDRGRARG